MRYTYYSIITEYAKIKIFALFLSIIIVLSVWGSPINILSNAMKMASNFLTSQSSTYMYVYNYNQLTNESPIIKKEKHCHHKLFRKFSVFVCVITPWICMMYFYDPNFMLNILLEIIWYKAEEIIFSLDYFQLMQR